MRLFVIVAFFISLIYSGCSDFKDSRFGTEGQPCFKNGTCKKGFQCVLEICVAENSVITDKDSEKPDFDSGNTGNSGDSGNTGNSGNSSADSDISENDTDDKTDEDLPESPCANLDNPCNDSGDIYAICVNKTDGYECNCSTNYTDNGTFCVPDTRTDQPCTGLLANTEWNTASAISQTWNGSAWVPVTSGIYSETATVLECRFKCLTEYHWDGASCISNSKTFTCADKPANSDWNTVLSYEQIWTGSSWNPPDSTTSYSVTASTTSCRYKCSTGNAWDGSECVTSTCSGNFSNTFGGLCWSSPTGTPKTWSEAGTHCSSISGRRPTISELRKLIQNCPSTQTGGSCGVTDSCLAGGTCSSPNCEQCTDATDGRYSVFGDMYWLWSLQDNSSYTANAWYVDFKSGRIYNGDKNYTPANYDVRCVK